MFPPNVQIRGILQIYTAARVFTRWSRRILYFPMNTKEVFRFRKRMLFTKKCSNPLSSRNPFAPRFPLPPDPAKELIFNIHSFCECLIPKVSAWIGRINSAETEMAEFNLSRSGRRLFEWVRGLRRRQIPLSSPVRPRHIKFVKNVHKPAP